MFFIANLATLLTSFRLSPYPAFRISLLPSVGHSLGAGHWSDPQWSPGEPGPGRGLHLRHCRTPRSQRRARGPQGQRLVLSLWTFPCPASSLGRTWVHRGWGQELGLGLRLPAVAPPLHLPSGNISRMLETVPMLASSTARKHKTSPGASSVLAWPPPSIHTG